MERIRGRLSDLMTSEQFSYRELRGMFFTLMLDSFFIFFIGMLSTAMVSSVGDAAIAAVSMVGTVNAMVSLMFTSLASGGAIVVSRAKGSGDRTEIRRAVGEVTGLCGAVALVLGGAMYALSEVIVGALYPQVEPLLKQYAVEYMRLMCISFIPFSVFNAIFNIFRNLGDTKSSLMLTLVINIAHLLLSLLFINGLGMGVTGSGLSYIAARTIGMLLALVWMLRVHNDYGVRPHHFFHFNPAVSKDIFSLGMPLAVESLLLQGGMLIVQVYLAQLPTAAMAAHARANALLSLYNTTASSLVALTSTVCGQCYGAKRYDLVRRYGSNLIQVGRFALLLTSLILYPLTPLLLKLYNASPESAAIVYVSLGIAAAAMPVIWCDGNIPAMMLRVAGDSVYTGVVAVAALALCRCVLGYVLTIVLGLGVPGIWISLAAEWIVRAAAYHVRLRGDQWLHKPKE